MDMDPNRLHAGLIKKGNEHGRARAYATTMDRLRKQVRAACIVRHIHDGASAAKASEMALIDDEYIEACERAEQAELDAGLASVAYTAAQAWFDAWRTLEATKRAEMTLR